MRKQVRAQAGQPHGVGQQARVRRSHIGQRGGDEIMAGGGHDPHEVRIGAMMLADDRDPERPGAETGDAFGPNHGARIQDLRGDKDAQRGVRVTVPRKPGGVILQPPCPVQQQPPKRPGRILRLFVRNQDKRIYFFVFKADLHRSCHGSLLQQTAAELLFILAAPCCRRKTTPLPAACATRSVVLPRANLPGATCFQPPQLKAMTDRKL